MRKVRLTAKEILSDFLAPPTRLSFSATRQIYQFLALFERRFLLFFGTTFTEILKMMVNLVSFSGHFRSKMLKFWTI